MEEKREIAEKMDFRILEKMDFRILDETDFVDVENGGAENEERERER